MALHVEGRLNVAADALSRDNLSLFRYQVPTQLPPKDSAGGVAGNSAARLDCSILFHEGPRPIYTPDIQKWERPLFEILLPSYPEPTASVGTGFVFICVPPCPARFEASHAIKVHLSAVRHLQIAGNYPDPFGGSPMPKLEYAFRGEKKYEAEKGEGQRPRLPITLEILRRLKSQ